MKFKRVPKNLHVKWAINDFCNLKCPFCIAEKEPEEQMDLKTQLLMVDKMYNIGVKSIDFFGKEPFYNDRIFEILGYCVYKYYPFTFSAITNGINLLKYMRVLKLSPLRRITISHDGFANNRQKVLDLSEIRQITRENFKVEISLDILPANITEVPTLVSYFFDIAKVNSVYVKPMNPVGELSETIKSNYAVSEEEYQSLCEKLKEIPRVTMSVPFRFPKMTEKYKDDPRFFCDPVCYCGDFLYINNAGTVYGCGEVAYTSKTRGCDFLTTPIDEILKTIKTDGKRVCCEKGKT